MMHLPNSIVVLATTLACAFSAPDSAALGFWQPGQSPASERESRAVESFLGELQLEDLLIEHLELEAARETDLKKRRSLAARLLDEYGQRMMAGQLTVGAEWQSKAELLLETYPELANPAIRIAILQSDYLQAETEFRDWWIGGRIPKTLAPLQRRWESLKKNLEALNHRLVTEYEDQIAMLQSAQENDDSSRRLARLDALLTHTEYLLGWSSYFLGVLSPQNRRPIILQADGHFRRFLDVDPKETLTEVAPDWFDFSSTWNVRALAGLAMCQRMLNHPLQSNYCFELIDHHATSQQTRDLRLIWDLNARVYADDFSAVEELVDQIGLARSIPETGRTEFWQAVLDASSSMRNRAPVIEKRLLRTGLAGLARQFDATRIRSFLSRREITLGQQSFLDLWINGLLAFEKSQSNQDPNDLPKAKTALSEAIVRADPSTIPLDIACCRFLLAKIQLRERKFEEAAGMFQACVQQFENDAPELSAESQWLAARALSEHSQTHSRSLIPALRAIDQLQRRVPGSTYAKRAEFEKLRLNAASLDPARGIAQFQRVTNTDPNYPLAANEIVKVRYRSWLDAHNEQLSSEPARLDALVEAQSSYEQLVSVGSESRLKSQLLVIDAFLRTGDTQSKGLLQRMEKAEQTAENVGRASPIYQEFRYYVFLLANRSGNHRQAIQDAQWLTTNAPGTPFERSAYVQLAQQSDLRLKSQPKDSAESILEATRIYAKLVELLGSSPADLKSSANARVALSKLAELQMQAGNPESAIELLEKLNQLFPNHKSYLRQLAQAYSTAQRYGEAIPVWRKMNRGVEPGSDAWLESKYFLALSLLKNGDRDEARKLHQQTCRLCPDVPESWSRQFKQLTELLGPADQGR